MQILPRFLRTFLTLVVAGGIAAAIAGFGLYQQVASDLPDYRWLENYKPPQMSRIYAANSQLMAELATERRVFVPISAIPKKLQEAFVAAEDQNFWTHHGVDPLAILRATVSNAESIGTGRRAVGASTITQQVAKNMLVGNEHSLLRKLREAILATRLEGAMSKDRILEIYLNEIYLGSNAYGVAAAAQNYFNKSLDDLSTAEMAFLAALPKAPNNYNPQRYPEAAKARRDWVLDRMADIGAITQAQADQAKTEPLVPRFKGRPDILSVGGYFTEEVRRELVGRFGAQQTMTGGLVVRTSLDPKLQAAAEQAVRRGLMNYDRRRGGWRGPVAKISAAPTEWLPQLQAVKAPAGMPQEWRLAVVLSVQNNAARMGWLVRTDPRAPAQPQEGVMPFQDMAWARPVRDGRLGAVPRRMGDVVAPGDVVMVEGGDTQPAPSTSQTADSGPVAVSTATGTAAGADAASQQVVSQQVTNAQRVAVSNGAKLDRIVLRQIPKVEGALVALDPSTGRVEALVGGWSFDHSQFDRATQALRQPGSSFKPFVYITALEQGIPPNQKFLDGPIEVMTPQGPWRPNNYEHGEYSGYVSMRTALEQSLNLVTIRIAQQVGMDKVAATAAKFGVIPNMPPLLSMSIGAGETTVMRMAAGYASFANGGKKVTPSLIDSVQDQLGRVIWRNEARRCEGCDAASPAGGPPQLVDDRPQIADPIAAYQITNLMEGVVQYGTGRAAGAGLNRPIAGKTGTTNDFRDNWFVGFTPDIVIAVWVGFDDSQSLGFNEAGAKNAAPIFHDALEAALQNSPPVPFRAPPGVALVRITTDSGRSIMEAFRPGTENAAVPPTEQPANTAAGLDSDLGGLY